MTDAAPRPALRREAATVRMMRRMSLRSGLALMMAILAMMAIAFLAVRVENTLTREAMLLNRVILTKMATQTQYRLDRGMFERHREVSNAAVIGGLQTGTPAARRAVLERLRNTYADYGWIGLADTEGRVVAATDNLLTGQSVASRDWFVQGQSGPTTVDVHDAVLLARLLPGDPKAGPLRFVDLAAPVTGPDGRLLGVLAAHLNWVWADEVRRSVVSEWAVLEGIDVFILRRDGTILLGEDGSYGAPSPCPVLPQPDGQPGAVYDTVTCADGAPYVLAQATTRGYRTFPGLGWIVQVRQPLAEARRPVVAARVDLVSWGITLALGFAAMGWLMAESVARPMRRLAQAAERIRQGDRDADLPRDYRFGEMAVLTRSLRAMVRDLREAGRRVAATAVEAQRERGRLDAIIGTMADALCVLRDGRIVFSNPAFRRLQGTDVSDGALLDRLTHPEDRDRLHAALEAVRHGTGPSQLVALRLETPAAGLRDLEANLSPFDSAEGPAVLIILRDITEQLKVERQLAHAQRIEAVGNLAGGVAHDFNNLLTVIIGNLDLMDNDLDDRPRARELADRALDAALRGSQLTRQLLGFARKRPQRPQEVDANALIRGTVDLLRRTLGDHVEIATVLAPDLAPIRVDRSQLENAVTNLAINARDAMPDGGTVTLRTRNQPGDGPDAPGQVVIEVADTGSGIDPAVLPQIFEPFFTTKDEGKGTGLGLSMVQGFVLQSGGTLEVESQPGKGTTFVLRFPAQAPTADAAPAPDPARPDLAQGLRVLLVEDRPDVRALVGEHLRRLGCRVTEAPDGQFALWLLEDRFDLLFTDIQLPGGLNGPDLARAARRRHPGMPVIFASGYAGLPADEAAALHDIGPVLDKPFRLEDVDRALRRAMAG